MSMEIPEHLEKVVEGWNSKRITAKDVIMSGERSDPAALRFEFSLPTYTVFGDLTNKTRDFELTVESLVSTKLRLQEEMDAAIAAFDKFTTTYDAVIAVLDSIKKEKDAEILV